MILGLALPVTGSGGQASDAGSGQSHYRQGLALTHQGNYPGAIAQLKLAQSLFSKEGNSEGAYVAAALIPYLDYQKKTVETTGRNLNPEWVRYGWLLQDFNYSGTFIVPPVPSPTYQGLLLFTRKVRDISQGPGRSVPVWGILDVKPLPKTKAGEEFSGGPCQLKGGNPDPGIAAIIDTRGQANQEKFTHILKAWRMNPKLGKIEILPVTQVVCINEASGV